jgi:hypothetical protein
MVAVCVTAAMVRVRWVFTATRNRAQGGQLCAEERTWTLR